MSNMETRLNSDLGGVEFDYDSIETGYYDHVFRKQAGIQSKWHHLKFARIRSHLHPPLRHLDVACGPGTFIGTLDESINSVGVDIAAEQLDYARATYASAQKRFELIDAGKLPFPDNSFDAVTCIELVEHLERDDSVQLATEMKRVLRPGGNLVLTTPDYGGAWPMLEWVVNRVGGVSYEDQHITRFTRSSLGAMLEQAGFKEPQVERYQFIAPFLASFGWDFADRVARIEPSFLTSRLGFLLLATASAT